MYRDDYRDEYLCYVKLLFYLLIRSTTIKLSSVAWGRLPDILKFILKGSSDARFPQVDMIL